MAEILKVGDRVTRMLGGVIPMPMIVLSIGERIVAQADDDLAKTMEADWEFDPATGMEIDDYLKWGPAYGATGSYLKEIVTGDKLCHPGPDGVSNDTGGGGG